MARWGLALLLVGFGLKVLTMPATEPTINLAVGTYFIAAGLTVTRWLPRR